MIARLRQSYALRHHLVAKCYRGENHTGFARCPPSPLPARLIGPGPVHFERGTGTSDALPDHRHIDRAIPLTQLPFLCIAPAFDAVLGHENSDRSQRPKGQIDRKLPVTPSFRRASLLCRQSLPT